MALTPARKPNPEFDAAIAAFNETMHQHYEETGHPKPRGEIIWHAVAKEDQTVRNGDWEYQEYSGMLSAGHRFATSSYQCREAIVALVEAVLTLGDGERRDPKTPQGFYPAGQRTGSPNRAT